MDASNLAGEIPKLWVSQYKQRGVGHDGYIDAYLYDLYDLIFGFMRKLDMFPSIQWFIM
jgi:hypothetical protein